MPDFMKAEAVSMTTLTSVASDDTHVNENDTMKQKLSPVALTSSLIDIPCNDEQQSDIRTERLSSMTLNSDDTSSSGGKDASMLQRQSFLSFNNESCLSFICPVSVYYSILSHDIMFGSDITYSCIKMQ